VGDASTAKPFVPCVVSSAMLVTRIGNASGLVMLVATSDVPPG
jgi:hypothetical protein